MKLFGALFVSLLLLPAIAFADPGVEREKLALISEQLEFLGKQAEDARRHQAPEARIEFDYSKLRQDLTLIKSGIDEYIQKNIDSARAIDPISGAYIHAEK